MASEKDRKPCMCSKVIKRDWFSKYLDVVDNIGVQDKGAAAPLRFEN